MEQMTPANRLDIEVEVLVDGQWWPGWLEHRRRQRDDGWEGFVRYTTGVAETRLGWFDYDQLRQVGEDVTGEPPSRQVE